MLNTIARKLTNKNDLQIGFTSHTLNPNQFFITISNASMASTGALLFGFTAILLHVLINTRLCTNFESGFYSSALMRGSTRISFLFGMYFVDMAHYMLFVLVNKIMQLIFGFRMPGFSIVAIFWALVDPLYLYFFAFLLVNAWRMTVRAKCIC